MNQADEFRYKAFLSYSRDDQVWAKWLQNRLERYRLPRSLCAEMARVGKTLPRNLTPIFRDQNELPASSDLGASLREALASSRSLIVICSPSAAKSNWVNEEIRYFKSLGKQQHVLCVLVEGRTGALVEPHTLADCFPPALTQRFEHDSSRAEALDSSIPLAADLRKGGDGPKLAVLKIIAGLIGVNLDTLVRREKARVLRQRALAFALALLALMSAFVGTRWAGDVRQSARLATLQQELLDSIQRERFHAASERLVELVALGQDSLANRLLLGWTIARAKNSFVLFDRPLNLGDAATASAAFSPDGQRLVLVDEKGQAALYDVKSGAPVVPIKSTGMIRRAEFTSDGRALVADATFDVSHLWDAASGKSLAALVLPAGKTVVIGQTTLATTSAQGNRIAAALARGGSVALWDRSSLSQVVVRQPGTRDVERLRFSPDGEELAVVDTDNAIHIFSSNTGQEIRSFPQSARRLLDAQFVPANRGMILLFEDGLELWAPGGALFKFPIPRDTQPNAVLDGLINIQAITVRADGKLVAGAASDGTIKVWDVDRKSLVMVLRARLTAQEEVEPDLGPPIDSSSYQIGERIILGMARVAYVAGGSLLVGMHTRGKVCIWGGEREEALFCVDGPRGRKLGMTTGPKGVQLFVWAEGEAGEMPRFIDLPIEMSTSAQLREIVAALPPDSAGPN